MVKLNSIILLGMSYFYVNKTKTFAFKIDYYEQINLNEKKKPFI